MHIRPFFLVPLAFFAAVWVTGCGGDDDGDGDSSEPKRVLILGDSISTGEETPTDPPWPVLLQQNQPEWTVVNSSRGGDPSGAGSAKVTGEVARHSPTHVVIFYGSNDAIQRIPDAYEGNLRAMVSVAQSSGAQVVIVLPPYMFGPRSIYNANLDIVLNAARNVARETGSRIANVNGEMRNRPELFVDGLHPNLDGQRIIMVTVREKI